MKILVTGGAGFIGSHVVDRYLAAGHEVWVLDNLITGSRQNLNPRATFVELDIRDGPRIEQLIAAQSFDVVNHHAAQMDVRRSLEDPLLDATVNILGSLNLIMAAVRHRVRKFIYISTGGAVYGEPTELPVTEDAPVNPECQYGISKHTVEHYLYLYRRLNNLEYTVLRYPNVYGPRQSPKGEAGVIAIFAGQMLAGTAPNIFGDGNQVRDYVFVSDIAAANELALDRANGEIVNLGSERGLSVLELFAMLQRQTGFVGQPKFIGARPGEIRRVYLSGEKAKQQLGWQPSVPVERGLKEVIAWIRNQ